MTVPPPRSAPERSAIALAWLLLPPSFGLSAIVAALWSRGRGDWARHHARDLLLFSGGTAGVIAITLVGQVALAIAWPQATAPRLAAALATVLVLACGGFAPVVVAMNVVEGGPAKLPSRASPTQVRRPVVRMRRSPARITTVPSVGRS